MQQQEWKIITFGTKITRRPRKSQLLQVPRYFARHKQPDQLSDPYTAATYFVPEAPAENEVIQSNYHILLVLRSANPKMRKAVNRNVIKS